jgi:hypothetical protein
MADCFPAYNFFCNYSVVRTALLLQLLFIKFPLVANKALKTRPYAFIFEIMDFYQKI